MSDNTPPQDATPGKGSVRVDGTEPAAATLTDAKRKAVEWYGHYGAGDHAATLRSLLDRLCVT